MRNEKFGIVTFKSTHHAIMGEGVFKDSEIPFKTIPTPREITLSCGLSLRFNIDDIEIVKNLVKENEMAINGVYIFERDGTSSKVEKIL